MKFYIFTNRIFYIFTPSLLTKSFIRFAASILLILSKLSDLMNTKCLLDASNTANPFFLYFHSEPSHEVFHQICRIHFVNFIRSQRSHEY